jgi:hypothetical protein
MRDVLNELNKHSVATATGISYSRLRKYSSGLISNLRPEEQEKIYKYLKQMADKCQPTNTN